MTRTISIKARRQSVLMTCSVVVLLGPICVAQKFEPLGVSDSFSTLYPSRTKTFIKSSTDPDDRPGTPERGNDDGFTGTNGCEAYRILVGGVDHAVLAHLEGRPGFMGCFFRNYWSDLLGVPQIPLEMNPAQVLVDQVLMHNQALPDYYRSTNHASGQKAPFDGVFTGGRAGGHLTHTTISWQNEFMVRVTENSFNNAGRFHKVCGTLFDPDEYLAVPSTAVWGEVAKQSALGQWPHKTVRRPVTKTYNLTPNGSTTVSLVGPATILELTCKLDSALAWNDIDAVFSWDSQQQPSVSVPLRLLGGMSRKPHSYAHNGVLHGNNGTDQLTCFYPMHFAEDARLEFHNRSSKPVKLTLTYALGIGKHPKPWGYFSAFYQAGVTQTHQVFLGPKIDDARGMLRAIALDSTMNVPIFLAGGLDNRHLEGDLLVRINGNRGDEHSFAASETSIGKWGWYGAPVDVPFSGQGSFNSGLRIAGGGTPQIETNRLMGSTFIFDPIHFVDGIEIRLEHGVQNESNAHYGLFTIFYLEPGAARETVLSIDVGELVSEKRASVQFNEKQNYSLTSAFSRDDYFGTPAQTTSRVREVGTHYRFGVQVPDGSASARYESYSIGCRLDRMKSGTGSISQAEVFVDGMYAGLVHSFTSNAVYRWKEGGALEVEIPRALTQDKSRFTVELRPRANTEPFILAGVEVYGYTK